MDADDDLRRVPTATSNTSGSTAAVSRIFSAYTNPADTQSTVILGAGIIGCATAYYLAHSGNTRPDTIHLVEASEELFASASGKAAGFLAKDWFGPATADLGALSFRLHRELAEQHDGRRNWGYSRSTGMSYTTIATSLSAESTGRQKMGKDFLSDNTSRANTARPYESQSNERDPRDEWPVWLTQKPGDHLQRLTSTDTVAQIDPLRLCRWLLQACLRAGVRLHHPARAVRVSRDEQCNLSGVRLRYLAHGAEHKLPCTRLLVAAGAWTPGVFDELFPGSMVRIPVMPLAGHSLVMKSSRWEAKECHAIFTSETAERWSPEIFSRVGGEIYIAGLNDPELPLPDTPDKAKADSKAISKLRHVADSILANGSGVDDADSDVYTVREGLCFRPVTPTGNPVVARVPKGMLGPGIETQDVPVGGVYVATGHGPWGISLALGTAKVLQEMMEGERENESNEVKHLGF
ncbi:hypothetical protein M433DRAFT_8485 [Acidomyces richmondensis BFW]|nr:hypothetical protein M433DRAFT_8485 [Acidomyces richmondensis BFW]